MTAYYNEFDQFAAAWLRELIKEGLIADGIVDDRSILEVDAKDLEGFDQHHFFAGIGGWSYALRLAGWSDSRPVCTASLPCQPFSVAGSQKGKDDERHLLPHFMQLVRDYGKFDTIMGEQVEGAVRHGWLDDLQANMEAEGYSTGAVVLGAHSVNAPHQRQRLYWISQFLANTKHEGLQGYGGSEQINDTEGWSQSSGYSAEGSVNDSSTLANTERNQEYKEQQRPEETEGERGPDFISRRDMVDQGFWYLQRLVYCRDGKYRPIPTEPALFPLVNGTSPNRVGILRGAGNAIVPAVASELIKSFMEIENERSNDDRIDLA